ncbi:gag-int-pol protein, partial [Lasius niger]
MFSDQSLLNNLELSCEICEPCLNGKQARLPFKQLKDKTHIKRPLFVVHSDVCGPINPVTLDDKNYFVIFVDQFTHYCVTYLIKYKSDVFSMFQDFVAKSEAHFNLKVVYLYIDNGREYLSNEMRQFCVKKGISYHLTVPHTPQLNGVSERMIRTITEKARTMVSGAKLDKSFWGEAVLTATYLINRIPSRALVDSSKTPYEMWHNKKPYLKHLRVFGATVYVHIKNKQGKFDDKSFKSIFVGYEPNGFKLWDAVNEKFIVARDVVVDETNMVNSRAVKFETVFLKDSKESENKNFPNDSRKIIQTEFPNESKECDNIQFLKDSKESNKYFLNESKKRKRDDHLNESKGSGNPNESRESETAEHLKEIGIDNPTKNDGIEIINRRSERLKTKPQISYNEEDNSLNKVVLNAHTIFNDVPNSFDEI